MISFSLYPIVFTEKTLWYGDYMDTDDYVGACSNSVLETFARKKINSAIFSKLYKKKYTRDSRLLSWPVLSNNKIKYNKKFYDIDHERDCQTDCSIDILTAFYQLKKHRKSFWNLEWYGCETMGKCINSVISKIMDLAEKIDLSDEQRDTFETELCYTLEDGIISSYLFGRKEKTIEYIYEYGITRQEDINKVLSILAELKDGFVDCPYDSWEEKCLWFSIVANSAYIMASDSFSCPEIYEVEEYSLPILDDWLKYKKTQKIDNGMLEKRAEYLFSIIENRNNRLLKFNLQEADYDMLEFYPHEMTSVHFSFFLKEVDEVISKLLKKYKFSDKKRKEFDYVNIL